MSLHISFCNADKDGVRFQRIDLSESLDDDRHGLVPAKQSLPSGSLLHIDATSWPDINPESSSASHFFGTLGHTYLAVKLAAHVELQPREEQYDVAQRLKKEAQFYERHLSKLQGSVVPVHYGLWMAKTSWGGLVVCEIMEWCGEPWTNFGAALEPSVLNKFAHIFQSLHESDIEHRQLDDTNNIGSHLLYDPEGDTVRIVDFSRATHQHVCERRLPLKMYSSCITSETFGCLELATVGATIGLFGFALEKDDTEVQRALQIYKKKRQMGLSHALALEAQEQFMSRYSRYH